MRLSLWPPAGIYTNGQHAAGCMFLIYHQISLQLRKVFTWTNQFCSIIGKQRGVIGDICDEIFILIEGSHSRFITRPYSGIMFFNIPNAIGKSSGRIRAIRRRTPGMINTPLTNHISKEPWKEAEPSMILYE